MIVAVGPRRRSLQRVGLPAVLAGVLLAITSCGGTTGTAARAGGVGPPGPSCLPAVPASTGASATAPASAGGARLPDLSLPCFGGTGQVRLTAIGRPAVVNLWASWCAPCRAELPALAAYAARAGTGVAVIGVDTSDTREAGTALLQDAKVGYPNLYDQRKRLLDAIGRSALPVTLFVDAGGWIRYLYNATVLDEPTIARLAAAYLGAGPG